MTSDQLFRHLRSVGAVLSIDSDGRLSFDGPDDVLTDERLQMMRSHRDELDDQWPWRDAVHSYAVQCVLRFECCLEMVVAVS